CVIFDAPRKLYLSCGFVGTCGWMVYTLFFNGFNVHTIYSSFLSFGRYVSFFSSWFLTFGYVCVVALNATAFSLLVKFLLPD
ncbi:threonine/serine exporter family protein, partial [Staphylococcus sp. EG-SA-21]|uniref:threonine/serine exporter family protein n=1 Tax=Staphylococcus sp. EG-SA-21 TaxID=2767496 RepID=UPI001F121F0D